MCHVFLQDKFNMPLDVHLLTLDSSLHNANSKGNTHHHYKEQNEKMKNRLIAK
jgi:hypothetical protein